LCKIHERGTLWRTNYNFNIRLSLRSVQFRISLAKTAALSIYYYYYYYTCDPFNNKIRGLVSCSIKACRGCRESLQIYETKMNVYIGTHTRHFIIMYCFAFYSLYKTVGIGITLYDEVYLYIHCTKCMCPCCTCIRF